MKEDWVAAEVDRRIALMEAESGVSLPRKKKREIRRRMERGVSRGTRRVEDSAREDLEGAKYPRLAKELKRAGVVKEAVYLRLGELPEGYERGTHSKSIFGYSEGGLSVFEGVKTTGGYVVRLPNRWLRLSLMRFLTEERREVYLLKGKRTGKGTDGEPLLSEVWSVEPFPRGETLASDPPSRALEEWNERRETGAQRVQ